MQPEESGSKKMRAAKMQPAKKAPVVGLQLTPDEYNAVIAQLVPLDIRITDLTFSVRAENVTGTLLATAEMEFPVIKSISAVGGIAAYQVLIKQSAVFQIVSTDEVVAAHGSARFEVRIRTEFEPPDAFWKIFARRNVKLYTHPPLRDLVASLAARAGLVTQPLGSVSVEQGLRPVVGALARGPNSEGTS